MPDAATLTGNANAPELAGAVEQVTTPPVSPPVQDGEVPQIRPETVKVATFEALMNKKRRRDEVFITVTDDSGEAQILKIVLQALDGPAFDKLTESYPPTSSQAARGAAYNGLKLTPALLAACVVDPHLTHAQWEELIANPNWAGGEISHIFNAAWRLCIGGLDLSFTVTG